MAFKLVKNAGGMTEVSFVSVDATGAIAIGDVVVKNIAVNGVMRANDDQHGSISVGMVFGVAASAKTAAAGTIAINVIPIVAGQVWEADCVNNSAVNQVMIKNALSSASVLNNSSTNSNTTAAIFTIYAPLGAASDKKVIGEFVRNIGGIV